ncbi:dienelactone hydrolase family protein [Anaerovorax odorimutans]|uniref:dienelactone hydrolase family protein n=1 Tax=Anaerovorax odorimutans TaxID=109327 RepID=UPI0004884E13|nr:dienelactone hydrolase family protein [Anaerovorax odorimutans]
MKSEKSKQAIVVLHEIYGVNQFIIEQCEKFIEAGYDVFCPNMIDRSSFSYEESIEAYNFFMENVGFEVYKEISSFINQLNNKYDNVFIVGFSVGATIAWRCCENLLCSGIVACYGSRIRDYIDINPICPMLLLFAKEDSFDVHTLVCQLQDKQYLSIIEFDAEHGFLDSYSRNYNNKASKCAEEAIRCFIRECMK